MAETNNTKTIAKAIACDQVTECASSVEKYVNEEVPKKLDSYTCTAIPFVKTSYESVTTASILVLCSGTPKKLGPEAPPSPGK